jgi:hypothetical protein
MVVSSGRSSLVSDSVFINPENWQDIEKGYFFQAAMYYLSDTEQPLKFLVSDENGVLSIEERNGDFDPIEIDGIKKAKEQDIVVTVKPRQVIILSNDTVNQSSKFEYIQIAPVLGLYRNNIRTSWYNDLINDNLEGFAYIPKGRYGVEVDLTQITTIHKSMLLVKQSKVPTDRMAFIESQIVDILDL